MTRMRCALRGVVMLLCCCGAASAAAAAPAPSAAKQSLPKPTYDLRFRPYVGMRYGYDESYDATFRARAAADSLNTSVEKVHRLHRQMVVRSEQVTELRDGEPCAKQITFGPNCWWAEKEDDAPPRKTKLVFSGKTVNFTVTPEGAVEQDFGVKPRGEVLRILRNSIMGRQGVALDRPVAVGERWRGDDTLRALLALRPEDQVSAILTLKAVRTRDVRQVADVGMSAGVITRQFGFHMEMSLEGSFVVDVETGLILDADMTGNTTIAGGITDAKGRPLPANVTGSGTIELHRRGKMLAREDSDLPDLTNAPGAATRPAK